MHTDHTSALAAAVLGLGGVGFLATKLDPGFADVFREAVVKVTLFQLITACACPSMYLCKGFA